MFPAHCAAIFCISSACYLLGSQEQTPCEWRRFQVRRETVGSIKIHPLRPHDDGGAGCRNFRKGAGHSVPV